MEDRQLLTVFQVTNNLDNTNAGSLRWAIGMTNAGGGGDTIEFMIGAGGVQTINITAALPTVSKSVTIDGTKMPGYNGTPLVQLDGASAGALVDGLSISAGNTTVVGLSIGNFSGNAISLMGPGGNVIRSNYLGLRADGDTVAPNGANGLFVFSNNNTVGGSGPGQGNVVSGNLNYGINLNIADTNRIQGNLVGVDAGGTKKRGNVSGGIRVTLGKNDTIGGTTTAARNVVSGNGGPGIETFGNSDGLVIQGNLVGTDLTGAANLGNGGDGIRLFSSNNTVGGLAAGAANVIAFNGNPAASTGAGVALVLGVSNNAILGNSIFANGGRGIDLGSGGNQNQQAPALSAVSTDGSTTVVVGTLSGSDPSANYQLEFFANDVADGTGAGEGQVFLGRVQLATDVGGNLSFNLGLPVGVSAGAFITATATDPQGNTSQFARNLQATGTADMSVSLTEAPPNPNVGDQVTYNLRVTNNGTTNARQVVSVFQIPGTVILDQATSADAIVMVGPNTITFNFGSLDSGKSETATIVVHTTPASAPSILASATVTSSEGDPAAGNNSVQVITPVNTIADVSVTVDGPASSLALGQDVTYTVTVNNIGPSTATNVTLNDTLPQNTTLVSAQSNAGSPVLNNNVVKLVIPSLPASGSAVMTIVVGTNSTTPLTITNSASVSASESDPVPANNQDSSTITLTPSADVQVTIADSPDPVLAGQNLTYTLTVTNAGPSPATNVMIVDQLPMGVTLVQATDNGGGNPVQQQDGSITDTIATLDPNASVILTIVVQAPGATSGLLTDSASVSAAESDPDSTNNADTETTAVTPASNLAVTLVGTPGSVGAGQSVTYTATVTNNGPSPATGVTLVDTLPANVTVSSVTITQGNTTQAPGAVTADIGPLAVNASVTMTIVVTTTGATGASITDTVTASGIEIDPVPGNNSASTSTSVNPVADLAVAIIQSPATLHVNETVTYTVTVTNNGPSAATGVTLVDTLPAGAVFISASDSLGNALTPVNGVLTDTIAALAANASVTLTVVVRAGAAGQLVQTATVSGAQNDLTPVNNTSLVMTDVLPTSELALGLVADQAQVTRGTALTYTATVVNNGPSEATGVTLNEQLPAGLTIVSVTPSQGNAAANNGQVTAKLGTLAVGASATLTIVVVPSIVGPSTNLATVTRNEDDPTPANNTATADVDVLDRPGTVQFAVSSLIVNENVGTASIVVTRTDGVGGQISVDFATSHLGTAVSGLDFRPVSGTLIFAEGESSKVIALPILANAHSKGDTTVRLDLSGAGGGAVLGTRVATTVVIHDLNPDSVAPSVRETRLSGPANAIQTIALFFSEGLDRAKASRPGNFALFDVGPDGRFGTGDDRRVGLRAPIYNSSNNTVTLRPVTPLADDQFYYVRATGLADLAGNVLSAGPGGRARAGYATYVARGTSLVYRDSRNTQVSLSITGGGLMDLTRFANGDGQRLQVLGPVPRRTVLTGRVRGGTGATTLQSITGLGIFGQVKVNMTTPPFIVAQMPFTRSIISPPAVDVVLGNGGVSMARSNRATR